MKNRICNLLNIKYPIIQGGMVWNSGWRLAAAVSNAGGLGVIGAGSMRPDLLREHIQKCKAATSLPFGVNLPLIYPNMDEVIQIIIEEKVSIAITSAGSPIKWTTHLKQNGLQVGHVISNSKFVKKCTDANVDFIVAEGFEAGGHNGREETTTFALIPSVAKVSTLPVVAAGGIVTGNQMLAAMVLGAEGIQMGTRFAASYESSSHESFKETIITAIEGSTQLSIKQLIPVRLSKNKFWQEITAMEQAGATTDELKTKLGKGRAKLGMFEGDLEEGELEFGQSATLIDDILPVSEIFEQLLSEYRQARPKVMGEDFFF